MNSPTARLELYPRNELSHVVGVGTPQLWGLTVAQALQQIAERFPARDAAVFVEQGVRWSWAELVREVDAFAGGLHRLGLRKGDRVGIWSPNRSEWLVTQFATARLGIVLVNINPAYRLSELEYALNKVGCKALVTAVQFKSSDYLGMLRTLAPELDHCRAGELSAAKLPHLRNVIQMGDEAPGTHRYENIVEQGRSIERSELDVITASLSADDAINVQFTSGTTGSPKGATLSHASILNNGRFVVGAMNFNEHDRLCIPVPLYHCFGMVMGVLGCVSTGATMVFPAEGFAPDTTLAALEAERCTALYGVPTMFVAQLQHPQLSAFDLSALRTGIMAGAPCPTEVMKQCIAQMNLREVTIAYGMTETSPVSFQSAVDDSLERRVSTVGRIQPHVECKVVDEAGETVPVGVQGELCTRGYSVMQGYWDDAERTGEAIDELGWMHTGDLATIDDEGYCNITGRVKDMLIRGGENVYPREIEEYLFRHPAVLDVQVFGVPDPKYGEEICAWIVCKPGEQTSEEEIKAFCRGQIAHFKIPRYVSFPDELPMTVTGKPQKFVMREVMMKTLGLEETQSA
jgi:fatty-acyl-CoA synthase